MSWKRVDKVAEFIDCSESHVWELVHKDPLFPRPVRLGPKHTVWDMRAVDAWVQLKAVGVEDGHQ